MNKTQADMIDGVLLQAWSNGVQDYANRPTDFERQCLLWMSGPVDGAGIPQLRERILEIIRQEKPE